MNLLMRKVKWVPYQGDVIWLDLNHGVGTEMNKIRPVVVISSNDYNFTMKKAIVCPVTSTYHRWANVYHLDGKGYKTTGNVISTELKCVDFTWRQCKYIERLKREDVDAIKAQAVSAFF